MTKVKGLIQLFESFSWPSNRDQGTRTGDKGIEDDPEGVDADAITTKEVGKKDVLTSVLCRTMPKEESKTKGLNGPAFIVDA